jgi:PAS domain S-box-containing protein
MPTTSQLSEVLSEFARTIVTDFPLQAVLDHLVDRIVAIMPIGAAGVTLVSPGEGPRYVVASTDAGLRLAQLQTELDEGPRLAACHSGEAISVPNMGSEDRFRKLVPWALEVGLAAVIALPLRDGDRTIGTLDLYRDSPGELSDVTMTAAQTLADVTTAYIVSAERRTNLSEATSRLTAVIEFSSDAIFSKTLDGIITSWNAGAEHMYGYSAEEIIGRNVAVLVPPELADELASIIDYVGRGARVDPFETQRVRKDGARLDVSLAITPIREASGAVVGAASVAKDITERNRVQSEGRTLERRLRQSEQLEILGQLAGGVAHDFNNLLVAISNYATFVAEQIADKPTVRADVEQIQAAAQQAARLTRQLLIFARRETSELEVLRLDAMVVATRELLAHSIGEHIELRVENSPDVPAVRADRGQMEQVLLNLAVNARDAMAEGGTLTISTRLAVFDGGSSLPGPDAPPGNYVELAVSDTGTGMSPEVIARIFEPFFTTKPLGQGTGLGLATVYGVVVKAGGTMSVDSEEGTGTTFRLYFPATDLPAAADRPLDIRYLESKGETVLIVEDEPAVLAVTSRLLRQAGYTTIDAATAEEALTVATSHDFQLLLTDVVMPDMSGRELAEYIGVLKPEAAVLYMSGYADGRLGPGWAPDEGISLVQKPFDRRTLLEKVRAAMSKQEAQVGPS